MLASSTRQGRSLWAIICGFACTLIDTSHGLLNAGHCVCAMITTTTKEEGPRCQSGGTLEADDILPKAPPVLKFFRGDELLHREVQRCGLQILA
jgi:hypothetical protein